MYVLSMVFGLLMNNIAPTGVQINEIIYIRARERMSEGGFCVCETERKREQKAERQKNSEKEKN